VIDDALLPARYQMAVSLGWHILIAAFGVAFPALIFVVHRRGLRGDADALELARRWSKVAGVLFALGAVSGTILSFELGLLWPGMMGRFGDVIGLPFAIEGIAFFTEAIFLGIYLYGWDRLPPRVHLATLGPVMLAGVVGSFAVVSANAWMNAPTGFRLDGGEVTGIDPLAAMFNEAVWLQWIHMWLAAYMVVGFVTASVYAAGIQRGRHDRLHHLGLSVGLAVATLPTLAQPVVGHLAGARLVEAQPTKVAAMELAWETERRAPLIVGGVLIDGEVRYGLEIPVLGSLIAGGSPDAVIPGLADQPEGDEVPASVVHLSFQTMVAIGFSLVALIGCHWWFRRRGPEATGRSRLLRWAVMAAGPASAVALLAGWVTTEVGRQPWIVYRVQRVDEAVTDAGWIWLSLTVIVVVYGSMTVFGVRVIRSMSRRWRAGDHDLRAPYGPPVADDDPRPRMDSTSGPAP
jgi:cytochrome d ubiquinol oxidase subunit I